MDEILTIQVRSFKVGFKIFKSQIQFNNSSRDNSLLTYTNTLSFATVLRFILYEFLFLATNHIYPGPHLWTFGSCFMRSMLREFCCKSHFISSPHSRGRPLLSYSCSSQYKTIYYHRCQICRKMVEKEHDQKYGKRAAVKRLLRCVM